MTKLLVDLPAGEMCPVKAYLMRVHGISGSLWKRIKHHGAFTLNGSPALAARTMVRDGDRITYDLPIVSTCRSRKHYRFRSSMRMTTCSSSINPQDSSSIRRQRKRTAPSRTPCADTMPPAASISTFTPATASTAIRAGCSSSQSIPRCSTRSCAERAAARVPRPDRRHDHALCGLY